MATTLARGDKRAYVVVDLYGEIHSLSRQLDGVKSKDLKARLAGYDLDKLPTAVAAQDRAREKRQELLLKNSARTANAIRLQAPNPPRGPRSTQRSAARLCKRLKLSGARNLEAKRQQLADRHAAERKALSDMQSARSADIARDRAARQPTGLMALLARITGFNAVTAFRQSWQDREARAGIRPSKSRARPPSRARNGKLQTPGTRASRARQARTPVA